MNIETKDVTVSQQENLQAQNESSAEHVTLVNGEPYVNGVPQSEFNAKNDGKPENVLAGIVGAFLFSLIGGVLYFVVYELGFIAGICALVMFILSNFGYGLFSGKKNGKKGVIIAAVMTLIMIILAEMFCLSYEIFVAFKDEYEITILDAMRSVPNFLQEPEIKGDVVKDLLFAVVFGVLATFSNVKYLLKGEKTPKEKKSLYGKEK